MTKTAQAATVDAAVKATYPMAQSLTKTVLEYAAGRPDFGLALEIEKRVLTAVIFAAECVTPMGAKRAVSRFIAPLRQDGDVEKTPRQPKAKDEAVQAESNEAAAEIAAPVVTPEPEQVSA